MTEAQALRMARAILELRAKRLERDRIEQFHAVQQALARADAKSRPAAQPGQGDG